MRDRTKPGPDAVGRCVGALVDVLIDETRPALETCERDIVKDYVRATLAAMPDYFRLGFRVLALAFELAPLPVYGHRFTRLAAAEQRRHVDAWRRSRIGPRRSMIAFYATFACYGLYSLPSAQGCAPATMIAA